MRWIAQIEERSLTVEVKEEPEKLVAGLVAESATTGELSPIDFAGEGPYGPFSMLVNGRSYEAYLQRVENGIEVYLAGRVFLVQLTDERLQRLSKLAGGARRQEGAAEIKAPMPGLVLEVHVKPGDEVDKGMPLIVLEAMKMENDLVAPKAGTVESVNVSKGDKVEQGRVLVVVR